MAKRKLQRSYKVIKCEYGKEIEFLNENGLVSVAQVKKAIAKEFPGYPEKDLYFTISDETWRLCIGTTY